jgi:hypothetical protein
LHFCTSVAPNLTPDLYLKPSAGDGVKCFAELMSHLRVGLDIEPTHPEVVKADFLKWIR